MPAGRATSIFSVAAKQTPPTPLPGTSLTYRDERWLTATFCTCVVPAAIPGLIVANVFGSSSAMFAALIAPAAVAPVKSLKTAASVVPFPVRTSWSAPRPSGTAAPRAATRCQTSRTTSLPKRSVRYWKNGQRACPL
jgi:hypothetical protein